MRSSPLVSHIVDTLRLGPLYDHSDLLRGALNSSGADFISKGVNLVFQKFASMKSPV